MFDPGIRGSVDWKNKQARIERVYSELLELVDPSPGRVDLAATPARCARFWMEFLHGEHGTFTTFESEGVDQMVVVSGMRIWSLCEHHLLPFWCDVSIGYIATGKVLGLSKFARISRSVAGRLQVQERLVQEIAATVSRETDSPNVAVLARGEHTCMTMRGVRTPAVMTSSAMQGVFRDSPTVRAEFLALCRRDA